MCNLTGIILSLLSLTSFCVIGYNSYMIYEHKDDFSCSNLDNGFIVGLAGYVLLFITSLFGLSNYYRILVMGSIGFIGAFAYNIYLYLTISDSCKKYYYNNKELFWYYRVFFIMNIFTAILIVLYCILKCFTRKSRNRYQYINTEFA